MVEIDNWVLFEEPVKIPLVSCNLFDAYALTPPDMSVMDEKSRQRFGPYFPDEKFDYSYENIKQNYIVMYLSINPRKKTGNLDYDFIWAALDIAAEESTGTWDPDLKTIIPEEMDDDTKENMKILQAKVVGINMKTGLAAIALPKQGFEYGNLPQLLSVVEGNYNGMTSAAYGVRLEDLDVPDDYADSFMGPQIGNEGLREILGDHISVGTIVKPKTGLSVSDWAKTAYRSFLAGLDVVKDDENLTNQEYCKFEPRARAVLGHVKQIESDTGRKLVYVPNITAGDMDVLVQRAELIKNLGGNCLMVDILAMGFTGIQTIRKLYPKMILHGHRAGHGDRTIFPEIVVNKKHLALRHGISMRVLTIFSRLAGIDQLHIGAPRGKMERSKMEPLENLEPLFRPMGSLKTVRPICSGGLKATVMWGVARDMNPASDEFNENIVFQAGGGTHAHDLGTFGGAKSMVQARNAIHEGKEPIDIMGQYFETLLAFRKWDNKVYVKWLKTLTKDSKVVVTADERPYPKNGKYKTPGPKRVDLITAIKVYPPLKDDLKTHRPDLLN